MEGRGREGGMEGKRVNGGREGRVGASGEWKDRKVNLQLVLWE